LGAPAKFAILHRKNGRRVDFSSYKKPGCTVLEKRHVNPETSEISNAGTCKKYRRTVCSGTASDKKL
jgi:hypothetical protein